MKKKIIIFIIISILGISSQFGNSLIFRSGFQRLDMNSEEWELKLKNLGISNKSMQGIFWGIGYEYFLNQKISFDISGGIFEKTMFATVKETPYNAPYASNNPVIVFNIYSVEMNINWFPIGFKKKIYPYIGIGGGMYIWTYKQIHELGDNFYPVTSYSSIGSIISIGSNVKAGIVFRTGKILGLSIESKYRYQRGLSISVATHIFLW